MTRKGSSKDANTISKPNTVPQKLSEQLEVFKGLEKSTLSEAEKSSPCGPLFERLETYSLKVIMDDLKNKELQLEANCFKENTSTNAFLKGFPETCQLNDQGQLSPTCQVQLVAIKSFRVHRATEYQSPDSLSTELLINRLMAYLTSQSFNTVEGKKNLRELGQELYKRLPENESAAKAAGIGYLMDDNLTPEDQQKFSDLGSEIRQKFPDNWEIYEINLLSKKNQNKEEFENIIVSDYQANPNSAIANYYMGCRSWKNKNFPEAIKYFQLALQISPNHKRFKQTLADTSDTTNQKVCRFEIGFNPKDF